MKKWITDCFITVIAFFVAMGLREDLERGKR